jgi:hypothetical protein
MLAKSPEDRPTAAEVAERFAAISAPHVVDLTAATAAMPERQAAAATPPAGPQPTAVMPVVMAARHRMLDRLAGRDLRDSRSAALLPRVMAIPAAAIALILIIVLAAASGSSGSPASAAASHHKHHVVAKVTVDPAQYVGQQWQVVRLALQGIGLNPTPEYVGNGPNGTVVGLAPTGKVAKGTTIIVMVARTAPAKPAKHPKPHGPGPAHVPPGHAKGPHGHGEGD